jgi:dihydrodipicolinate synthase/N-acetylneuraminate lyase
MVPVPASGLPDVAASFRRGLMKTKERYPLRGVVVSLNTPFDEKDHIDFASVERSVEMHLLEGAVGFLTPAQAGEVTELSLRERIELVRFVRELTAGRAQVIAGATADSESESRALAEAAVKAGCEIVLAEVPPARRGDAPGILDFFRSLAAVGIDTLMIQDLQWGGPGLDVQLIATMFEMIPAFRCLKVEVAPAGPKYTAVLEATGGGLHVSGGWASDQMIEALDRGVDVFIPTAMTRFYRLIFDAYSRGDRNEAQYWFHKILPVLAFTRQHLEVSIHFYKHLFHHRGLFSTRNSRKHCIPYDRYHEACGDSLIAYLDQLEEEAAGKRMPTE